MPNPLFMPGQMLATPGALKALTRAGQSASAFLDRHVTGDWGVVSDDDKTANDDVLKDGSRLLSAYVLSTGAKIWIITEAVDDQGHRNSTTVLLPDEY